MTPYIAVVKRPRLGRPTFAAVYAGVIAVNDTHVLYEVMDSPAKPTGRILRRPIERFMADYAISI